MKNTQLKTSLLLFFITMISSVQGQYLRKFEFNASAKGKYCLSNPIAIDSENSVELGNLFSIGFGADLNFNINQRMAVGLTGSVVYMDDGFSDDYAIKDYKCTEGGVLFKFNLIDKKKFKLYSKVSAHYFMYQLNFEQYYYIINSSNNEQLLAKKYSDSNGESKSYNGIGAEIDLGMKIYFTHTIGMLMEAGYFNDALNTGPSFKVGLFIDFVK